jgi:O-antigen/teichoic acid export membrane protein/SAM-dependent methyltransferase
LPSAGLVSQLGDMSNRTVRNVVSNVAASMVPTVVTLVVTPMLVRTLGVAAYGVYALTFLVVGYFSVIDLNVGAGAVKYLSEFLGKDDSESVGGLIGTTLAFTLVIASVGGVVLALCAPLAVDVFRVSSGLRAEALEVFRLAGAMFAVGILTNVFSSVPQAMHRYDALARVNSVGALAVGVVTVAALRMGTGLYGVILANAAVSLLTLAATGVLAWRLLKPRRYGVRVSSATARYLARYASGSIMGRLSGLVAFNLDRLIVGSMVGAGGVAYYTVPNSLSTRLVAFAYSATQVLMPVSSALTARGEWDRLRRSYLVATRLLMSVATLPAVLMCVVGRPLLALWLTPDFADRAYWILVLVTVANYMIILTMVPSVLVDGAGHPRVTGAFSFVQACLNLVLIVPLTRSLGLVGAAWAFLAPAVVMGPLFIAYAHRTVLGVSNREYLRAVAPSVLAGGAAALAGAVFASLFADPWAVLFAGFGAAVVAYLPVALLLRAVAPDDVRAVWAALKGGERRVPTTGQNGENTVPRPEEQMRIREAGLHPERITPGAAPADAYAEHLARYQFAARLVEGAEVLDIGCGVGYGSDHLARIGCARHVCGIDISDVAIDHARRHFASAGVEFSVCDAASLPCEPHSIDVAVAFEVLEHLDGPADLLREVGRVLAPGGCAVLSVPNGDIIAPGWQVSPNKFHAREYSLDEIRELVDGFFGDVEYYGQQASLRVLESRGAAGAARHPAWARVLGPLRRLVPTKMKERVRESLVRRARLRAVGLSPVTIDDFPILRGDLDSAIAFVVVAREPRSDLP